MKLFKTEKNSDVARTLTNIAAVYSQLGQKQKALEIYERDYCNNEYSSCFDFAFF